LFFFLQFRRDRLSFVARGKLSDADSVDRRRAVRWREHVSGVPLRAEPLGDGIRLAPDVQGGDLDRESRPKRPGLKVTRVVPRKSVTIGGG